MSRTDTAAPTLATIQRALRETTETLACDLVRPCRRPPEHWSASDWLIARAAASLHGISPLLAQSLRWQGPPGWEAFLQDQRAQTLSRYEQMRGVLSRLDAGSRQRRVGFIALKGAALHDAGIYSPGDRPMADLDLLARESDVPKLARVLEEMGFERTATTWKHEVFEPGDRCMPARFGEHAGNSMKIDLHSRISEIMPRRLIDVSEFVMTRPPSPGLNPYPTPAAMMIHLLLHAAGAMLFRTLRFVQIYEIGRLVARFSEADWSEVLALREAEQGLWWALPPLALVDRYYGSVPQQVLATAAQCCSWPLRRASRRHLVSDVSFSDLRRSAFPGLRWAQSSREMLAYVMERSLLSARVLARRPGALPVSPGPPPPQPFPRPNQHAEPWLALRPARPATLQAVQAVLAAPRAF